MVEKNQINNFDVFKNKHKDSDSCLSAARRVGCDIQGEPGNARTKKNKFEVAQECLKKLFFFVTCILFLKFQSA